MLCAPHCHFCSGKTPPCSIMHPLQTPLELPDTEPLLDLHTYICNTCTQLPNLLGTIICRQHRVLEPPSCRCPHSQQQCSGALPSIYPVCFWCFRSILPFFWRFVAFCCHNCTPPIIRSHDNTPQTAGWPCEATPRGPTAHINLAAAAGVVAVRHTPPHSPSALSSSFSSCPALHHEAAPLYAHAAKAVLVAALLGRQGLLQLGGQLGTTLMTVVVMRVIMRRQQAKAASNERRKKTRRVAPLQLHPFRAHTHVTCTAA